MKKTSDQARPEKSDRQKPPGPVRIVLLISIILAVTVDLHAAQKTAVRVNVPQRVSQDFNILIGIDNALNLDAGQFDLVFNPEAFQVLGVSNGTIEGIMVPVDLWTQLNPGRIRVLFNFPGVRGICGTGHLAKIRARAIGKTGHPEPLAIQKGLLVDQNAQSIPVQWVDGQVDIEGCAEQAEPSHLPRSGQAPETGKKSRGMTISTPMAMAGLAALALFPALLLVILRKRKRHH